MAFTLNAGEFDLGDGCIGRGTILAGESYSVGTATTGIQGLLNTSGLEGISYEQTFFTTVGYLSQNTYHRSVCFRESNDLLTSAFAVENARAYVRDGNPPGSVEPSFLQDSARFWVVPVVDTIGETYYTQPYSHLNSSSTSTKVLVSAGEAASSFTIPFRNSSGWRFLARDHATAITHYPSTAIQGSVFAAACVNSATQWGLWAAGAVGNRNGYFNQRQGDFAIVLLQNGANTYFSVMTPQTENSSTRNDSPLRNFNIVPAAGQTTVNDQMSELVLLKNTGSFFSSPLGTVPGLYYIDPNKTNFDSYTIGMAIDIDPDPLSTFEGRDRAIIVARWGLDATISISNSGNVFTAGGSPNRRTLENGARVQFQTSPPSGFSTGANYWVINWNETSYTFNLASTEGGSAVTASSNTSSTIVRKAALIAMRCY